MTRRRCPSTGRPVFDHCPVIDGYKSWRCGSCNGWHARAIPKPPKGGRKPKTPPPPAALPVRNP